MREYYPLFVIGAIIGVLSIIFSIAYALIKDKKNSIGFERHMSDGELIKRLFVYIKPYYKSLILICILLIIAVSYDILAPLIVGWLEELVKTQFKLSQVFIAVAVYVVALIISVISTYVSNILLQKTGQRMITNLRMDLFAHIESLSRAQLSEIPVGKLVTRVTNDANSISMIVVNTLSNLVKNIFVIFGVLIAMIILNFELTLMVLTFVPFLVLFTTIFRKFSRKAYRSYKNATTDINTFLSENLSGMKIVQAFNREEAKQVQFDSKNDKLRRARWQGIFTFSVFRPVVYMLYVSSVLCLFYLSGKGYVQNTSFLGQTITSGVLVSFYMFVNKFFTPIQNIAEIFNRLQSALASAEKIFTIFDIQPENFDSLDAIELDNVRGEIEFDDVWFAYKKDEWVLKGVSFKVSAEQSVAFVGATGSGKSTILSLICKNYLPIKGRILIDGIDIRRIKTNSLRKHFGQMLQDVFLFSGTIRSNIVLREDIDDSEVNKVCKYVNADSFINKLPKGLYEEVREGGNNFSAGQRQLLSFARTLAHKPSVIILDEATANIDTQTELLIQDSLEKMRSIGTMLIVAHRLSTIQHSDNIIVLDHGEIIERGTHLELLENRGKYYQLYVLQYEKKDK